ncbi:MAG: Ig-like domain-containing protein [Eubacterium sp.]|nr:Ig-like domain-containing protein [Eubacterium sp.]
MKAGEIVEKCQNHPNEALKKTKIPALGHKYSAWTVTKKATAVTTGTRERNCTVCKKAKQIEPIAKLKPTAKLNVVAGTLPLKVKQAFTVKVTGLSKGDSVAAWTSSNSKVAIVKNGKITAKKVGNVQITVKLKSGLTKTIKVRVQKTDVATQSLKVNNKVSGKKIASNVTLKLKQTLKLSTEITPVTSKQKVTYATSNKKVATVNSKGVVTAKKKGKVTITVKSGKKTVKIKVTVK